MRTDIAVVGGGAAGMFAAVRAAELGAKVTLVERNPKLGRKLGITGKGRCNLTNDCDASTVIKNTPRNGRFLFSALAAFSPEDAKDWFESRGVPLKTERGQRMFPTSDKASDIVDCLRRELGKAGVKIVNSRVTSILLDGGRVTGLRCADCEIECKAVILATGGLSYPGTGSTGDGYDFARLAGHTIEPTAASIVPLVASHPDCSKMMGLGLKNVKVTAFTSEGKHVYDDFGELLFTHFGISGPVVLSMSAHLRDFSKTKYYVKIDLKPALDEQKLDARILRDFGEHPNRTLENLLGALEPRAMIEPLLAQAGLDGSKRVNEVTREERRSLIEAVKGFRVDIVSARPIEEAVVTSGGVSVREIDPKTMRSKLADGLYFAGEIIDVDAYTGGFNLQIAWSTGYVAGTTAAEEVLG